MRYKNVSSFYCDTHLVAFFAEEKALAIYYELTVSSLVTDFSN